MSLPVYPGPDLLPGLAYSSKWSPSFFTQTVTTATGADIDVAIAQYPLHDFELSYRFLRAGPQWGAPPVGVEFQTLMGFFLAMQGTAGRFLYRNPDDYQVANAGMGHGDGITTTFTVTRGFGTTYSSTEPVGQVELDAAFNVYLGGSATPVDPGQYVLDATRPCANTITFATAPDAGEQVRVDMSYYYYCKFAASSNSFEKFMDRLWTIGKVQLHSCRAGA